jgi:hypothetical protein
MGWWQQEAQPSLQAGRSGAVVTASSTDASMTAQQSRRSESQGRRRSSRGMLMRNCAYSEDLMAVFPAGAPTYRVAARIARGPAFPYSRGNRPDCLEKHMHPEYFLILPSRRARNSIIARGRLAFRAMLLGWLGFCCAAALALGTASPAGAKLPVPAPPKLTIAKEDLVKLLERRTRTGVGMDNIPALYRPSFVSVSDASLSMEHDEIVFIVMYPTGLVRMYPQRIMVWHEVVNDVLPDPGGAEVSPNTPLSALDAFIVTYSPLTGTVAAYYATAGRFPSTFGVTGELLNANTLMYDRMTGGIWVQLTGTCIDGPLLGRRLSPLQVIWSTWRGARELFPNAQVMSRSTGHRRNYGRDPYGSYQRAGTYYDDLYIQYPVTTMDTRLPPKKRVLGIEQEGIAGAVQVDEVKKAGIVNMMLGLRPLVAVYHPLLETVLLFDRRVAGEEEPLSFSITDGKLVDNESKSEWGLDGACSYGSHRDKKLAQVPHTNAMWFAWAAFYPQTIILPETSFTRRTAPVAP